MGMEDRKGNRDSSELVEVRAAEHAEIDAEKCNVECARNDPWLRLAGAGSQCNGNDF